MPYMEFETSPTNEDCVSVSSTEDYMPAMRVEANKMLTLLNGRFQDVPGYFRISTQPHDFGSYLEIRYHYPDTEEGNESCNFVENNFPDNWTDTEPMHFQQ